MVVAIFLVAIVILIVGKNSESIKLKKEVKKLEYRAKYLKKSLGVIESYREK